MNMDMEKYDEIEIELVMDAYGVGRARALAILKEKDEQAAAREEAARKAREEMLEARRKGRVRRPASEDFETMTAADFFGAD